MLFRNMYIVANYCYNYTAWVESRWTAAVGGSFHQVHGVIPPGAWGHPARCRGHPARCRGHPARCWGHPARCRGHPARCKGHPARCRGHPARCRGHPARCRGHPARCRGHPARCKGHPARCRARFREVACLVITACIFLNSVTEPADVP